MCHTIAQNAADGGYTKKFVARNVAEVERDSTAAILLTANFGVDTPCNSAIVHNIACNIALCIRTLYPKHCHAKQETATDAVIFSIMIKLIFAMLKVEMFDSNIHASVYSVL